MDLIEWEIAEDVTQLPRFYIFLNYSGESLPGVASTERALIIAELNDRQLRTTLCEHGTAGNTNGHALQLGGLPHQDVFDGLKTFLNFILTSFEGSNLVAKVDERNGSPCLRV